MPCLETPKSTKSPPGIAGNPAIFNCLPAQSDHLPRQGIPGLFHLIRSNAKLSGNFLRSKIPAVGKTNGQRGQERKLPTAIDGSVLLCHVVQEFLNGLGAFFLAHLCDPLGSGQWGKHFGSKTWLAKSSPVTPPAFPGYAMIRMPLCIPSNFYWICAGPWLTIGSILATRPMRPSKQGGPENPKARQRTARLFKKILWCGPGRCALHEIDVRSLLKHRAHWWYPGPKIHHSMLCQLRLHSSSRYFC